ncbi:major facilitator superfamily transporter [Ceratobasidium sp. AG-Ba]|nr:major facilitator superfamily transporter [Ceratobasidium sp. AG-Ba]
MATIGQEQRPLLGPTHAPTHNDVEIPIAAEVRTDHPAADSGTVTPLPMKQLSILMLMGLCEPITFTVIYPFVAELVNKTGVTGGDSEKIGYYAGLIESIFFLTESLFVLQYGRASDRLGRRPVLMFGLFGLALSIFSFGLSKTFGGLIFTRALSGALNGNVGVAKSMISEITDETNQAQCFSFMPMMWSLGSTLGPFIGGTFSNPAKHFPWLFGTSFWEEYPYFLPCLIAAMFTSCVFILSALFLEETHHPNAEAKPQTSTTEYGTIDQPDRALPAKGPSLRSVLTKRACIAIINYAFLAFSDITYLGIIPVMFAASVQNGGLGLNPRSIGLILGLQGVVTGIVQVFCFAPIHRRFGSKRTFVAGLTAYMCLTLSLPVMNALARRGIWWAVWLVMGIHLGLSCPAFMAFGCMTIFVISAATSKSSLGTLNGASQTTISICRAIGPATATSLFAFSIERQVLGGYFVYAVLTCINIGGLVASRWLKEEKRAH